MPMNKCFQSCESGTQQFVFTGEGTWKTYLCVNISRLPKGKGFTISHIFLADQISKALNFNSNTVRSTKDNVPVGFLSLIKGEHDPDRKESTENVCGVIGMLD